MELCSPLVKQLKSPEEIHAVMVRFLLCLFLLISSGVELLASDSSQLFLKAYQAYQQGEKLEQDGCSKEALAEYWKADSLLMEIRKSDPSWQSAVIDYRLKRIRDSLRRLQPDAKFLETASTPVVPSSDQPTGAPVLQILSAELKEQDKGAKELQVTIKSNPKATIEVPHVRVQAFFYDNDQGKIVPSKAQVTSCWLNAPVDWRNGETEVLKIRLLPDFAGSTSKFAGYQCAVYYKGDLQDCRAQPKRLQKLFKTKYYIGTDE
jgi:hypothetical protein